MVAIISQIAHPEDAYKYPPQIKVKQRAHSNRPPYLQTPSHQFPELNLSSFFMAQSTSISLIFIFALVCSTPAFEARKVLSLKKGEGEVSTVVESLGLASPHRGLPALHSSSGHAVVNINGRLFTLHLPSINHRMLTESVPSPGIGHTP